WCDGYYDRAACAQIDHILRDHESGDVYPMNVRLLDLLHDVQTDMEHEGAIEVISGYRSHRTAVDDGAAKHSYHSKGMAIDVRLPGVPLPRLHKAAESLRRGGVGYYPDAEFVHLDVGAVRGW